MPVYHFDTESSGLRYEDADGIELDSIDQAREQLAALLRDLTYHDEAKSFGVRVDAEVRCSDSVVLHGSCCLTITTPST